jgi:Bacterial Ig domain
VAEVRIAVGRFVLQLGAPQGTRADPGTTVERESRERLAAAFREPPASLPEAVAAGEELVTTAEQVTRAIEQAESRIRALADGLTLDPRTLSKQVDALVSVFARADREGRFADEVKLGRTLVTLLALVGRWAALLETLRRVGRAAAAVGDRAVEAWVQHERGSLALAAGQREVASDALNWALAARNALGDERGAGVTLHNLQLLAAIEPDEVVTEHTTFVRRNAVVLAIAAVVLLGLAGALVAYAVSGGDEQADATTATTTAGSTTDTMAATTTEAADTTDPTISFEVPELSSGTEALTAQASDDGGSVSVTFAVRPSSGTTFADVGTDDTEPFTTDWDTTTVEDGVYVVRATATDAAEHDADAEGTTSVDNTAPRVELSGDIPAVATQGETLTVAGTADDGAGSGVSKVTVTISPKQTEDQVEPLVAEADVADDGTFSVDVDMDVPNGAYEIEAVATDGIGNTARATRDLGVAPRID